MAAPAPAADPAPAAAPAADPAPAPAPAADPAPAPAPAPDPDPGSVGKLSSEDKMRRLTHLLSLATHSGWTEKNDTYIPIDSVNRVTSSVTKLIDAMSAESKNFDTALWNNAVEPFPALQSSTWDVKESRADDSVYRELEAVRALERVAMVESLNDKSYGIHEECNVDHHAKLVVPADKPRWQGCSISRSAVSIPAKLTASNL